MEDIRIIGPYDINETIGSGTSCIVKVATHRDTGQHFAIKMISISDVATIPGLDEKVRCEIALMRILDHPHVVHLFDVLQDDINFYLVMEYGSHGELFNSLVSKTRLSLPVAMRLFRQLIYGLEYLHQRSICHRDLKPENLFLDDHDNLKIGDFGLARWAKHCIFPSACGSLHYLAPEVLLGQPYDGRKADVWSCGVILFALVSGRLPFVDATESGVAAKIRAGRLGVLSFPAEVRELIPRILCVIPAKRLSIEQIKAHPAFRIGLPEDYELSHPLPIPPCRHAFAEIPEFLVNELRAIGYDDRELCAQLSSSDSTEAKIFCDRLMSHPLLHWGDTGGSVSSDSSSDGGLSDSEGESEGIAQVIADVKHGCPFVMNALQKLSTNARFDWCHPNEVELICRRRTDGLAVVMSVREEVVGATVKVRLIEGDVQKFDLMMTGLTHAVRTMRPDR
jgi:BR serine/threonine kinase